MTKARDLANASTALSAVSATELGYLDGVTSAVQTQINTKQAVVSGVDDTELGYLNGVTSAIQTQLDAKAATSGNATQAGTETLTNKTLTAPVISSPKISSTYTAKTAAYTFASGDEGQLFSMNNAASVQFNIPTDATFNFAVGTEINVFWITGAGQPTIGAVTPGTTTVISTGATSATPKLRVANSMATCKKLAANSWIVVGDIA